MSNKFNLREISEKKEGCGRVALMVLAGMIVLLLLLVAGCNAIFSDDDDEGTTVVVSTTAVTEDKTHVEEHPKVVTETVEVTATETTTANNAAPAHGNAPAASANQPDLETWAKEAIGGSADESYATIAGKAGSPAWAFSIADVIFDENGNIAVRTQLNADSDKDVAEEIAKLFAEAFSHDNRPADAHNVTQIVVQDGAGEMITQESVN
ncbi:hypothetical protein CPHO_08565 [Corynebacterium phocae]|uniref:Uncharacterized protein n=1 Tax=Corynebacterium phocae TaxID=161895 RepID=A0A1L7D487_9CORY|nr:hypothetical protein [Corynebacterium phocae]APT92930.1 hypothetical protein CPHO_08565 [Corynebacterium phocae]KAA8723262.1 hypothetical protein F4V58_08070 [Corynebacterium phocae]